MMRKHSRQSATFILVSIAIMIILQMTLNPITPVQATSFGLELAAQHTIHIMNGGSVTISLEMDLQNNNVSLSNFLVGFPAIFKKNLDNVFAYNSEGTELTSIREGVQNGVFWFNFTFMEPLKTGETSNFLVHFIFSGLIVGNTSDPNGYIATFPENPILPVDAYQCDVEIVLPTGITAQQSSLNQLLNEIKAPLQAYTAKSGFLSFTGDFEILTLPIIQSEATIEPWGHLRFENSYTIQNIGKTTLRESTMWFPENAKEIRAYDIGGSLDFTVQNSTGAKVITMSLRYPLRGSIGNITHYDSATFTVTYRIDSNPYLTSSSNQHSLQVPFPEPLNYTIHTLTLRVTLPEGGQHQQSTHTGSLTSHGLIQSITYTFTNLTSWHTATLVIHYDYSPLWTALRPGLWIGTILLIISGFAFYRKKRKSTKQILSDDYVKLITTYIDVYDERLMLWSDFDSLEESLDQKQIRKRNYNRRIRIVQQRLNTLKRASTTLKTQLRQLGPHYASITNKVENAESDIEALRETLQRIRRQYRSGRFTRRMYSDLTNEPEKKIERAKKVIEGAIITLRSEL